jgi:uncharacterized protein (TIGR03435 family)
MDGPTLRALLEDRFKLKVHREIREVPVYSLTLAKSGPQLKPFRKEVALFSISRSLSRCLVPANFSVVSP